MKSFYLLLLSTVILAASGCDILHFKTYQVSGVSPNSADAGKVTSILQNIAGKTGLKAEETFSSNTNVLVSYTNANSTSGGVTILTAWFYQDSIYIGLTGGYGTPPEYRKAKRLLKNSLSAEFGSRFIDSPALPKK